MNNKPRMGGEGLTPVATDALKHLLALVHRDELNVPLDVSEFTRIGLQDAAEDLSLLRGLDKAGVRAVLVAVLAERKARE